MNYIIRFAASMILAIAVASPAFAVSEARSISFPAVSADGETVYFTCWGDIWSAPRDGSSPARRLTDNVAFEGRPVPSPDGSKIAFLSDRYGNFDIFVMPEGGGQATRLTWHSATDYPYDWKPDGSAVLCYAIRQDLWGLCAYEVPLDGSQPRRLTGPDHDDHVFPSYLGDADHLVFTRGPGDWARKHHTGSDSYDLWMVDLRTGKHTELTNYEGKDAWPQPTPDGKKVYFVSDRDGAENLWELTIATGALRQVTHFDLDGPRWPRISSDGDEVAFERMGELYIAGVDGTKPEKVKVVFADDAKHEMALDFELPGSVSEYAISPNGNYYALVVYGDIYILKNPDVYEEEPDQNTARTHRVADSPGREMHLDWSPDSTELAYLSDRDGQFDVYTLDLVEMKETQITDTDVEEWYPKYAPKGGQLAYYRGKRELFTYDLETKEEALLVEGQLRNGPWSLGYEWAPDGYWLAVNMTTMDSNSDVFFVNTEDRELIPVSFSPDWDQGVAWSPDGKYFAYTHWGENASEVMLLELDPEEATYDTSLLFEEDMPAEEEPEEAAADEEPAADETDEAEDVEAEAADAEEPADEEDAEAEDEEEEIEPLKIDLDRIHLRARALTTMQGIAYDQYFDPNSSYIVFQSRHEGEPNWWSVTIDGNEFNMLTSAITDDYPQWSADGSKLHFLSFGNLTYLQMAGPAVSGGGMVPALSHASLDQFVIWDQMLFEGWRHLRDGFYDPEMHGVDWDSALERYRPRIGRLGTIYEYNRLYREMLGELGASHLGFFNPETEAEAPPETTGSLGVVYAENHSGPGWLVETVITDGPADQPGSELYPGDLILGIDGEDLAPGENRARLLRNRDDKPLTLMVRSGEEALTALAEEADGDEAADSELAEREVVIMPAPHGAMRQLAYEQWVEGNRQMVYQLGDGRIGYQHIQTMNGRSLAKFRRELFSESRDKDAVIIDVRFNGGGGITEQLVEILDRKPFSVEMHRDSVPVTQPVLLWEKPVVVLINAHSFSDAEYFPHVMKELGLGTIIGEPTGGNVISTYDFELLDGSILRLPAWGIWLLDGTNMEGNGAQPDIYVHIDPEKAARGEDNQIETAVEFLLGEIG